MKEIDDYIQEERGKGISDEQIKKTLLDKGWMETDVNAALNLQVVPRPLVIDNSVPPPPSTQNNQPAQVNLSNSKMMAILSYLGILIVVPFATGAKSDPFVKFHMKQGLALIILWIILSVLSTTASFVLSFIPFIGFLIALLFPLLWLFAFILMIVGIVNAANSKTKLLPIIGSWGDKFNF